MSRAYRTVSHAAATTLAGLPPLELADRQYAEVYRRTKELRAARDRGEPIDLDKGRRTVKLQEKTVLIERWKEYLSDPNIVKWGRSTVDAVQPCLAEWLGSRVIGLTYHATQVLTGHGCFGVFLCRIEKEATTRCWHCDEERDTAQHTLEDCPAWSVQRRVLTDEIGFDLSLPAVVAATVEREEKWKAFVSFCGSVMSQKEASERIRRGEVRPHPTDREEEEEEEWTPRRPPRVSPPPEEWRRRLRPRGGAPDAAPRGAR
ncbi:uncharacterized protein [Temnothorax nylanderi]|uniref:uncharacterized protein n=1 Tax=Temnothorax nylanderi TaxID=102681 RepID=UPI003A8AAA46